MEQERLGRGVCEGWGVRGNRAISGADGFVRVDPLLHDELSRKRVNGGKLRDEFFESSPNWVRQSNGLLERYAAGLWPETRQGRKNNKYDSRNHPDSGRLRPLLASLPLCSAAE